MKDSSQLPDSEESREKTLLLRLRMRVVWAPLGCFVLFTFVNSLMHDLFQQKPVDWILQLQILSLFIAYPLVFAFAWRYTNTILVTKEGVLFRSLFARKHYISWRTVTSVTSFFSKALCLDFLCDGSKKRSARIHSSYFTDPKFIRFVEENKVQLPIGLIEILSKDDKKSPEELPQVQSKEDC